MKSTTILALAAALSTAAPAMAKEDAHGLSRADQTFLEEATMGNMAEVNLGTLAVAKGTTPTIREFGRWMISTHSFANRELTTITARMHGENTPVKPNPKIEELMGKLQNMTGKEFDKAYLEALKQDHEEAVQKIAAEAKDGKDYLVKSFAANFEPAVKEHLAQVDVLLADLDGKDSHGAEKGADMKAAVGGMIGTPKGHTDQAKEIEKQHE